MLLRQYLSVPTALRPVWQRAIMCWFGIAALLSAGLGAGIHNGSAAAATARGDLKQLVWVATLKQNIAYRLYLPSGWSPARALPLVVIFPGGSSDENAAFDREPPHLKGILTQQADQHGFILLSLNPHGGSFGAVFAMPGSMKPPPHMADQQRSPINRDSETAARTVIDQVVAVYRADRRRIYLMGNSMGEVAVMHFAEKYPGKWCAIAPSDGPFTDPTYRYDRLAGLSGALFHHGDHDQLALMAPNRAIAAAVAAAGVPTQFVVVPGGTHTTSWYIALPQTFAFFDSHRCGG